jgi:hypothetical protein
LQGAEKSKVLISLPPLLKVENNKHERLIEKKTPIMEAPKKMNLSLAKTQRRPNCYNIELGNSIARRKRRGLDE